MAGLLQCQRTLLLIILIGLIGACSTTLKRDLQNGVKYYRVKQGDTLYAIGFRSGYGYRKLATWNQIKPPYKIKIGWKIKLFKPSWRKKSVKTKIRSTQKKPKIAKNNRRVSRLYWQWPMRGKISKNFYQTDKKGINIFGKYGQIVKSAALGKVVYSGDGIIGYGNLIIIKHNEVYLSAYANNSRLLVNEGQAVNKGQVIAEVGLAKDKTSTLHFEIRKYGKPVNPLNLLPKNSPIIF